MEIQTRTIRVYSTTKERLDGLGRKGETYDQIINKLLTECEEAQK